MFSQYFTFLAELAKKYPALARTLELAIYTFGYALVGAFIGWLANGNAIEWAMIFATSLAPIQAGIEKRKRDLEKALNASEEVAQ